jgi:DNA replication protein DnaC
MIEKTTKENILACEKHGDYTATTTATTYSPGQLHEWTTMCPTCEAERTAQYEREEAERVERKRRERIADKRKKANIPARFAGATFENYIASTAGQERALSVAQSFAHQFDSIRKTGSSLTFCGGPGCGKTHLACAIANCLLDSERDVIYTQAIELVRAIRDTWRTHSTKSETEVINSYRNAGLLIVNEIGVQFGAEAEKNQMFDVLDGRYREMRPTLIISNLNDKGLQECLGPRVFDRLMESGSAVATFNWASYRRVPKSPLGAEV